MGTNELIKQKMNSLVAEKKALLASTEAMRKKREGLVNQMEALRPEVVDLTAKINAAHGNKLMDLSSEITRLAKVLGAKSLSD